MKLLVTGGSGFLGGYVLDEARRRGHEVVGLTRSDKAADAVAPFVPCRVGLRVSGALGQ